MGDTDFANGAIKIEMGSPNPKEGGAVHLQRGSFALINKRTRIDRVGANIAEWRFGDGPMNLSI